MGIGALDYQGVKSGLKINGATQSYYVAAGEKVSTGDFVEFVNGIHGGATETQVRKATTLPCKGVAKTGGWGGSSTTHNQQVKVYVPNV